jgi:hypothetical protein
MKKQGKIVELSKKQEKETEILANRIMPKTDFEKVIEHDKLYFNTLNQALEFNVVKQDILGKQCQRILANQTRELVTENINLLCEWAETQVKVLDMKGKLRIQQKLVEDKEIHFENVFMPQFNKELEEASKNYVQTIKDARELMKLNREYFEEINEKLVYELSWWDKTTAEQKLNDEYIIQIYKPLKRLINAYRQKEELQKESTKYSK